MRTLIFMQDNDDVLGIEKDTTDKSDLHLIREHVQVDRDGNLVYNSYLVNSVTLLTPNSDGDTSGTYQTYTLQAEVVKTVKVYY